MLDQLRSLFSEEAATTRNEPPPTGMAKREDIRGKEERRNGTGGIVLDAEYEAWNWRLSAMSNVSRGGRPQGKGLFVSRGSLRTQERSQSRQGPRPIRYVIWNCARISSIDCSTLTDTSVSGCPSVLARLAAMQIEANLWTDCVFRGFRVSALQASIEMKISILDIDIAKSVTVPMIMKNSRRFGLM